MSTLFAAHWAVFDTTADSEIDVQILGQVPV